MSKKLGNLFEQIANLDSLYEAFLKARKGKRKKKKVHEFERNLGYELNQLLIELQTGIYKPKEYVIFWVKEPKPRKIYAPHFRDVVVQHALYNVVNPIFDKTFIHDSYGCRKGKGVHAAGLQLQRYMRSSNHNSYTLQLDVKKFFYRIDREILSAQFNKKIKDVKVLQLMNLFLRYPDETGIPIGNLMSQLYSNIYLNVIDQYIKRELNVKKYIRYVDDLVLLDLTKKDAYLYKHIIEDNLKDKLKLEYSKFSIAKISRGVNFVGFRTWRSIRLIRKHCLYNFKKNMRLGKIESMISTLGHAKNTTSYSQLKEMVEKEMQR